MKSSMNIVRALNDTYLCRDTLRFYALQLTEAFNMVTIFQV
jgi:hypothetical protein